MRLDRKMIALASAALVIATAASSVAADDPALIAARNRNPSLRAYSFHVDVAMRMRTFPWLRFHAGGTGNYVRGRTYEIQLTQMPFFARSIKTIDLSPLDPTMWPKRYFVQVGTRRDGLTTFNLRERRIDPSDKNPLVAAQVTLDQADSTRDVVLQYTSGSIHMALNPAEMQGFILPVSSEVDINMPGQNLSAHADFNDYAIVRTRSAGWLAQRH